MERRPLGTTGIEVSVLALGTVKFGRNRAVRYPRAFELPSDAAARELLAAAADLGVNLLDTAPAYGTSEARLGQLLRGQRDRWLIATKVGEEFDGERSRFDFTAEAVTASVERSLARLGTDRLDVVLIHSDGADLDILANLGTLQVLERLRDRGLVRAIGMSHKTVAGAEQAIVRGADVIMATLNANDQSERDVIAQAGRAGCGVLVKKALASGRGNASDLAAVAAAPGVSSIVVGTLDATHLAANARAIAGQTA
jgi:aryl-alcohol dehydrogenase-like predicted oxidoreductase